MSRQLSKAAPILVVAIFLGYLCWPYLDDPARRLQPASAGKGLENFAALLKPTPAPPPERDPFNSRSLDKFAPSSAADVARKTGAAAPGEAGRGSPSAAIGAAGAIGGAQPVDLDLQATHLRGDRRIALINGTVYAEGDEIKSGGATAVAYTVARIYPHSVVLQHDGETTVLNYSRHDSKAVGGRAARGASNGASGPKTQIPAKSVKAG